MRLVIGTTNAGKIREIERVLHGFPITVETAANYEVPPVIEDGDTFEANACKKAMHYARHTGCVALADDSGLEVAALRGEPGVFSARYAGEHATDEMNNGKLLAELENIPVQDRDAQFRCVLAIATPGGRCETVEGICSGSIGLIPRGDQGFGYDPLFVLPDGRTMAELSIEEKNRVSHRGQALQKLRIILENFINEMS